MLSVGVALRQIGSSKAPNDKCDTWTKVSFKHAALEGHERGLLREIVIAAAKSAAYAASFSAFLDSSPMSSPEVRRQPFADRPYIRIFVYRHVAEPKDVARKLEAEFPEVVARDKRVPHCFPQLLV